MEWSDFCTRVWPPCTNAYDAALHTSDNTNDDQLNASISKLFRALCLLLAVCTDPGGSAAGDSEGVSAPWKQVELVHDAYVETIYACVDGGVETRNLSEVPALLQFLLVAAIHSRTASSSSRGPSHPGSTTIAQDHKLIVSSSSTSTSTSSNTNTSTNTNTTTNTSCQAGKDFIPQVPIKLFKKLLLFNFWFTESEFQREQRHLLMATQCLESQLLPALLLAAQAATQQAAAAVSAVQNVCVAVPLRVTWPNEVFLDVLSCLTSIITEWPGSGGVLSSRHASCLALPAVELAVEVLNAAGRCNTAAWFAVIFRDVLPLADHLVLQLLHCQQKGFAAVEALQQSPHFLHLLLLLLLKHDAAEAVQVAQSNGQLVEELGPLHLPDEMQRHLLWQYQQQLMESFGIAHSAEASQFLLLSDKLVCSQHQLIQALLLSLQHCQRQLEAKAAAGTPAMRVSNYQHLVARLLAWLPGVLLSPLLPDRGEESSEGASSSREHTKDVSEVCDVLQAASLALHCWIIFSSSDPAAAAAAVTALEGGRPGSAGWSLVRLPESFQLLLQELTQPGWNGSVISQPVQRVLSLHMMRNTVHVYLSQLAGVLSGTELLQAAVIPMLAGLEAVLRCVMSVTDFSEYARDMDHPQSPSSCSVLLYIFNSEVLRYSVLSAIYATNAAATAARGAKDGAVVAASGVVQSGPATEAGCVGPGGAAALQLLSLLISMNKLLQAATNADAAKAAAATAAAAAVAEAAAALPDQVEELLHSRISIPQRYLRWSVMETVYENALMIVTNHVTGGRCNVVGIKTEEFFALASSSAGLGTVPLWEVAPWVVLLGRCLAREAAQMCQLLEAWPTLLSAVEMEQTATNGVPVEVQLISAFSRLFERVDKLLECIHAVLLACSGIGPSRAIPQAALAAAVSSGPVKLIATAAAQPSQPAAAAAAAAGDGQPATSPSAAECPELMQQLRAQLQVVAEQLRPAAQLAVQVWQLFVQRRSTPDPALRTHWNLPYFLGHMEELLADANAAVTAVTALTLSSAGGSLKTLAALQQTFLLNSLPQQVEAFAVRLLQLLPVPCCCNNPGCTNDSTASELLLVGGPRCVCARCHLARYCSISCQAAHWEQHKDTCNAIRRYRRQQQQQQEQQEQQQQR